MEYSGNLCSDRTTTPDRTGLPDGPLQIPLRILESLAGSAVSGPLLEPYSARLQWHQAILEL